jgi:hypothetical protein
MQALIDGTIKPEGIDLIYQKMPVEEIFWRTIKY